MKAVFDTNIVIDALNGLAGTDNEFNRYEQVLISRLTRMEVLAGAKGGDAELRDFLETHFEIIPLDLPVAESVVKLRRKHHMHLPDAIIWATNQVDGAVLVTRNTKDFDPQLAGIRVSYQV